MGVIQPAAAQSETNGLPPAAAVTIEFTRDIQPIFQQSCFRCHGPEKPKSHFRLDDREAALKGGDNGVAIVPGDSADSPLIHFVAQLDPDMVMPPEDKGDPLTSQQVGLLRAWIDQGANWGEAAPKTEVSMTSTLRWIDVSGSRGKFRELEGVKEGWGGGIQQFSLRQQLSADEVFSVEGHAFAPDNDYRVQLMLKKNDVGFTRGGFEIWRKYFDDRGGFAPNLPENSFTLGRDLHLDVGRAWFEAGLTLPERPQVVLGYEYQFRQGDKSTLQWGLIGDPNAGGKNVYPAFTHIDEKVHVIRMDASHELYGWWLEDNARVEFYELETRRRNGLTALGGAPPDTFATIAERDRHVQGMNTFSLNKQLKGWLAVSGGYFYSRLEGDAGLRQNTVDGPGTVVSGYQWSADRITLFRESQIVSVGALAGPWAGLTLSAGVQGEWTRQESMGFEKLLAGLPDNPDPLYSSTNNAIGRSDSAGARENVLLRYTQIPFTVLFAEARLQQERLDRFDQGQFLTDFGTGPFTRDTDADIESKEYRLGFNTSPWARLSFGGALKHGQRHIDYDHRTVNWLGVPNYPGFLEWRDTEDNQAQARVVWRAATWARATFNYRWRETEFQNATPASEGLFPGGSIDSGRERAGVYSVNMVLTPFRRLYLSSTFSYTDSRVTSAQNGASYLAPYEGDIFSVLSSATLAVNAKTDLKFHHVWSRADYGQRNQATGLPAGLDFERHGLHAGLTRQINRNLAASLTYGYFRYDEPTAGGVSDYEAHAVFTTVTMRWP